MNNVEHRFCLYNCIAVHWMPSEMLDESNASVSKAIQKGEKK